MRSPACSVRSWRLAARSYRPSVVESLSWGGYVATDGGTDFALPCDGCCCTIFAAGVQCREAGPGESGGGAAAGGTGILSRGGEFTVAVVDTIPSIFPLQEHRLSVAFLSTAAARSVRDLHLPCRGTSACEMCFFAIPHAGRCPACPM